jgi:signal transduction histidine kinase
MTIKKRLSLLFTLNLGLIILLISANIYFFNTMRKEIYFLEFTDTLRTKALQLRRYEKNIFLKFDTTSEKNYKNVLRYMQEMEFLLNEFVKINYKYNEIFQLKETLRLYKQSFFEFENTSSKLNVKIQHWFNHNPELLNLLRSVIVSHPSEVSVFLKKLRILKPAEAELFVKLEKDLQTLRNLGENLVDLTKKLDLMSRSEIERKIKILKVFQIIGLGFITGITLIGILLLTRSIIQRCRILNMLIEDTGKGIYKKYKLFKISDELDFLIYRFNLMEEKLKEREEELERQREELFQTKRMAALGRLLTKISHELNNPVNNLFLTLNTLERDLSPGERDRVKEYLEDLQKEIRRIKQIVEHFLIYSKKRAIHRTTFALTDFLHKIWENFKKVHLKSEVFFEIDSPEDIKIEGDPILLESVFMNLFKNAYEAMDGKGKIKITTKIQDGYIHLEVRDTGKGIPEEIRDQIFEPFFSTKPSGIGIGLSLAKEILQKHGGDLLLKETSMEGTTFEIILPLAG